MPDWLDLGFSLGAAAALTAGRYVQRSNRRETLVALCAAIGKEGLTDGRTIGDVDAVVSIATSFFRHDYPRTNASCSGISLRQSTSA